MTILLEVAPVSWFQAPGCKHIKTSLNRKHLPAPDTVGCAQHFGSLTTALVQAKIVGLLVGSPGRRCRWLRLLYQLVLLDSILLVIVAVSKAILYTQTFLHSSTCAHWCPCPWCPRAPSRAARTGSNRSQAGTRTDDSYRHSHRTWWYRSPWAQAARNSPPPSSCSPTHRWHSKLIKSD